MYNQEALKCQAELWRPHLKSKNTGSLVESDVQMGLKVNVSPFLKFIFSLLSHNSSATPAPQDNLWFIMYWTAWATEDGRRHFPPGKTVAKDSQVDCEHFGVLLNVTNLYSHFKITWGALKNARNTSPSKSLRMEMAEQGAGKAGQEGKWGRQVDRLHTDARPDPPWHLWSLLDFHSCLADAPIQSCWKIKVNEGVSRRAWRGFLDPSLHSIPLKGNVSISEQWLCTLACEGESGQASAGQSSVV